MTVGELNHLMTYITEGWMLFSIGFIGIEFVSFVSRRIQEDIEADKLALKASQTEEISITEAVESAVAQRETQAASITEVPTSPPETSPEPSIEKSLTPEPTPAPKADFSKSEGEAEAENSSDDAAPEALTEEDEARLEEVAAVSEQLAKTKSKQSDSSSVSVST